jgi:hypothetical protein
MNDPKERLVSSGVDVWSKRTRALLIDQWYRRGDYHEDRGDGLDFYKVGKAPGCGGLGVFDGGALHASANFSRWKVVADGPLRAVFELTYDSWDAGGRKVSEQRRVSIDAGASFSRVEGRFDSQGALDIGVGIVQREGQGRYRDGANWMSYWVPHGRGLEQRRRLSGAGSVGALRAGLRGPGGAAGRRDGGAGPCAAGPGRWGISCKAGKITENGDFSRYRYHLPAPPIPAASKGQQ